MDTDVDKFRYPQEMVWPDQAKPIAPPRAKQQSAFIRGPIPLVWIQSAAKIPRRNALIVGLVLFHLAGLNKSQTGLVLCVERCKHFGLDRRSVRRGLAELEAAGLIHVDRSAGRCARVSILAQRE